MPLPPLLLPLAALAIEVKLRLVGRRHSIQDSSLCPRLARDVLNYVA
jgi:hypothetical protein